MLLDLLKEVDRLRAPVETRDLPPWTPFVVAAFPEPMRSLMESEPGHVGVFRNSRYQVSIREQDTAAGKVSWLSIVRLDRELIRDWRELQRIKNELTGPECEGCEIYPAESRLVDTNNQQHLFVLPPGLFFPFGYPVRDVGEKQAGGSVHKQRPFENPPPDLDVMSRKMLSRMGKR